MSRLDSAAELRAALAALAANFWFTWIPGARGLFEEADPVRFDALDHNPTAFLSELSDERLAELATTDFPVRVRAALDATEAEARRTTWWERRGEDERVLVAYFSCEFGLDESLPIYSGGLGVLAGDHLKSASDLGLPLVGVGLFYREGYFRQELDRTGLQVERYPDNDPAGLPLTREPAGAEVELADASGALVPVNLRVWRARGGRIALYLLDTDVDGNPAWARTITDALYGGDREHRLRQELVLGIGGVRVLRGLGLEPTVFHLNEGHSALLQLERLRELVEEQGLARDEAMNRLRASTVFTTHTPVPAGNEVFDPVLVERNVGSLVARCGFAWDAFAALGRVESTKNGFGLTPFALRTCGFANAVSELHGEVSREMWRPLWPESRVGTIPIGSVTNGVHARTWLLDGLDRLLGVSAETGGPDFARAASLDDDTLWSLHAEAKRRLLDLVANRGGVILDPDALTLGFARRFATYKRADLILSDMDRLGRILGNPDHPVQLLFAGKAHPADEGGKALIRAVLDFADDERAHGRVVFLPDYEMTLARLLVQGVDVWLNTPRRPFEASGTSGMKAALNGVVNCSVLDGWWCEGYSPLTGFAVGLEADGAGEAAQDAADAESLYVMLEDALVPAYYDRARWLELMRGSISLLGPRFTTDRMLREYVESLYLPAHEQLLGRPTVA